MTDVFICDYIRTPIGRFGGALAPVRTDDLGAEPLRARLSWEAEPGVLYYLGGLSDGRVNWSFVQSASLAPSITLPPWGADLAAPEVRGGSFSSSRTPFSTSIVHSARSRGRMRPMAT